VQITDARAARLHRMARLLDEGPKGRAELLQQLRIGLRTFYRELELLRRCGIKVRLVRKQYQLQGSMAQAESRLPFPDPRLSFAELIELASYGGPAARRMAELLRKVLDESAGKKPGRKAGDATDRTRGGSPRRK
jgi:predicted DNA-binding transcriptional regulator YafY